MSEYWKNANFKPKECLVCESAFTPSHPAQKYCTDECWLTVQRQYTRDWYWRNQGRRSRYNKKYHADNSETIADRHYKNRYGVTLSEVRAILDAQKGKCAICKGRIKLGGKRGRDQAVVDHCHDREQVRGLLCANCNLMIGYAQDNANTLARAVDYVRTTNQSVLAHFPYSECNSDESETTNRKSCNETSGKSA